MTKRLTKHGNSLALVIDKAILELLDIDADTPLKITTDGRALRITPAGVSEEPDERFEAALQRASDKYARMLKRLAE
jgi:antitoxin component of MazEF toxin-antitoxin module